MDENVNVFYYTLMLENVSGNLIRKVKVVMIIEDLFYIIIVPISFLEDKVYERTEDIVSCDRYYVL